MARKKNRSKILVYGRELPLHVDEPREDEHWIHAVLLRWAQWCRERKAKAACSSAEGNYVAPKGNVYNPPEPGMLISAEECREVNGALLDIPEQTRNVLAARYFLRLPDSALCRKFDLKQEALPKFMRDARLMLQSTLLSRRRRGILAGNNSTLSV